MQRSFLDMKCWNCSVEIVRAENWTPANRVWIENPENAARPHDFKKCYKEALIRDGKWNSRQGEEDPDEAFNKSDWKLSDPFITNRDIKYFKMEVYCYYCEFHTRIENAYQYHVLKEHPKKLCYPGKIDLRLLNIAPKGYYWET